MAVDALHRARRLAGEVVEELALARRERAAGAADRDDADASPLPLPPRSGWAIALASPDDDSRGVPVRSASASTDETAASRPFMLPARARSCSVTRSGRAPGAPGIGRDAVDGGAHDDLQQRVAVELGGDRLAEAAHRVLHALALLAQLGEAALELARHLVELLAEAGELVLADGRHLRGEVAAGELARGVEEARELLLQRARHEHRAGEGEQQEADEDRADTSGRRRRRPRVGVRDAERDDADLLAGEAGGVKSLTR